MLTFPLQTYQAGKKLLLITNSDYHYTNRMMNHAFNRFLPNDVGWRDLFEMVKDISPYASYVEVTVCQSLITEHTGNFIKSFDSFLL
jgi:hypothetical protein